MKGKKIKLEIQSIIHTKDGKILKKSPWKETNCLIKAFIQLLNCQMAQAYETIYDTSNVGRSFTSHANNLRCTGNATDTAQGIVIGSGENVVTMDDYALQTQITGDFAYGAQTIELTNPSFGTWRINISRTFTNNTGSSVSIKEVGLYLAGGNNAWPFCCDRTLHAVDVADEYPVTIIYRITITL